MIRILPGLYTFTGLMLGRVYLIEDPDGLTIIDAGVPLAYRAILRQLASAGRSPHDVKRIIVTHAHPDHIGSLPALARLTGAEVWASGIEKPVIEGSLPVACRPPGRVAWPPPVVMPATPVSRSPADGEMLPEVMSGVRVLYTPGHTPGHISLWQPSWRVLICGDVMVRALWLRLPSHAWSADMDENRRSIARLAALKPEVVCFGHGNPLKRDTARTVAEFARRVALPENG